MKQWVLWIVCTFLQLAHGQIIYRGKCKKAPLQENFNLTRFSGRWHEVSRSFTYFEFLMGCVRTDYVVNGDGKVDIRIQGFDPAGRKRSYNGKAEVKDPSQPAKLKAKFRIVPLSINYNILTTDYDHYAVVWTCTNIFGGRLGHTENLWLLSRTPTLEDHLKHEAYTYLDNRNVNRNYLENNRGQSSCFEATIIPDHNKTHHHHRHRTSTTTTTEIYTSGTTNHTHKVTETPTEDPTYKTTTTEGYIEVVTTPESYETTKDIVIGVITNKPSEYQQKNHLLFKKRPKS